MQPHLIIAGFGPGLGQALKNRFQLGGFAVTTLARSQGDIQVDLTNPETTQQAIEQAIANHGTPTVVVHNVATLIRGPFLELNADDFETAWKTITLSAINLSQSVIPTMEQAGKGCLIFSGATASTRGSANFGPFASAKFALRGLSQSLAREFQPKGLHIVHPILDGIIWSDLSLSRFPTLQQQNCLQPDGLANIYWDLAHQPASTWTHEIDLRPQTESF